MSITYDSSKEPTDFVSVHTVQWFVCIQARILPRKGPTWGGPKLPTPYQKPKTRQICPTIFGEAFNFIFFFVIILIYFSIPIRRGVHSTPWAASLQLGISTPGKFTTEWWRQYGDQCAILTMCPKNAGLVWGPYIIWLLDALLKSQSSFCCSQPH